ncbi:MAG: hypothetical protein GWO04_16945, partial [Actinobacteria bacterium]|nr:hypothetical protein [Actinomycetota bacterium]
PRPETIDGPAESLVRNAGFLLGMALYLDGAFADAETTWRGVLDRFPDDAETA